MSRGSSFPEARLLGRESLAALIPEWEALAAAAAEPNPFYEHWALLPALEADPRECLCVAVWIDGALAALFPLEPVARYRGLPVRALRSWRNRHMLLCTPLVRAGFEDASLRALVQAVRSEASIVELDYVAAEGPLRRALDRWTVAASFERALLRRADTAEAYIAAALDGNTRRELRRKERRLKEAGRMDYVRLAPGGDAGRWIDDFLRLEASGWKGAAGGALACNDADRRYAGRLFRAAFERGALFAGGLDLDGRPIAREMCLTGGEGAFSFRIAYDEAYARYAPGLLGELETVRALHAHARLRWVDSCTGSDNMTIGRLWKDRRRVERLDAPVDALGAAALLALGALRKMKKGIAGSNPLLSAATIRRSLHGVWVRRTW